MSSIKYIVQALKKEKSCFKQAKLFKQGYETLRTATWAQLQRAGTFEVIIPMMPTWEANEVRVHMFLRLYDPLIKLCPIRKARSSGSYAP